MPTTLQFLKYGLENNGIPLKLQSQVSQAVNSGDPAILQYFSNDEMVDTFLGIAKVVTEDIVFDPQGGWNDDLAQVFLIGGKDMGAFTRIFGADADPSKNVEDDDELVGSDGTSNPWQGGPMKARVGEGVIKPAYAKRWMVDIPLYELRQSFMTNEGMDGLIGLFVDSLRKKAKTFLRDHILEHLALAKKEFVVPSPEFSETEESKLLYAKLMWLSRSMTTRPKKGYNELGFMSVTPKERLILIQNIHDRTATELNVTASLFNSDLIGPNKYFSRVLDIDDTEGSEKLGYVADSWAYKAQIFLEYLDRDHSGRYGLDRLTWHSQVKEGFNPMANMVALVNEPTMPTITRQTATGGTANTVVITALAVNPSAVIRYTTDGSDPTATTGSVYTAPFVSAGQIKAAVFIDEDGMTASSPVASMPAA